MNCVEYFTGGDEPKLLSGSDDFSAKVCILLPFSFFFFFLSYAESLIHMLVPVWEIILIYPLKNPK